MPSIPIIMPQLGESIAEATVINLLVNAGDEIRADQDILEVETSKATMNVSAPCSGRIDKWLVKLNESYAVGAVLGYVVATEDEAQRVGHDTARPAPAHGNGEQGQEHAEHPHIEAGKKKVQPTVRGLPVPANAAGASYMSPRLKA